MADVAPVVFKERAGKGANARKRPVTPPPASDSEYSSEEDGPRVKRRRKGGVAVTAPKSKSSQDLKRSTAFTGDRSTQITNLDDATKLSNWFDSDPTKAPSRNTTNEANGTYKDAASYSNFVKKNPEAPQRGVGPVKGPSSIRTINVSDFASDVCRDYKTTDFCWFGDSCKFLHATEDSKQGWQPDREWDSVTKGKKMAGTTVASANRGAQERRGRR